MYRIRIFILSLIHVSFVNAFAQGQLKGIVLSGASGTGLEGVHVRIVGTEAMAGVGCPLVCHEIRDPLLRGDAE